MIPVLYCNNKHFKGKTEKRSIRYLFGEITVIFALYTTFCFSIPITLVLNQNVSFTRRGTKFSWCPQKEKAFRQHKQWHKSLLMVKADTELETCVTSWDPVWWRKEVIPQQDTSSTTYVEQESMIVTRCDGCLSDKHRQLWRLCIRVWQQAQKPILGCKHTAYTGPTTTEVLWQRCWKLPTCTQWLGCIYLNTSLIPLSNTSLD